jgi:hypothetical protein
MGHVAVFLGDSKTLETEARVAGALCARDGTKWLEREDDDEVERVLVVLTDAEHERGYRAARPRVEASVSGADWKVMREAEPRVLVSTRALTREERDTLRSCDDCAAAIGERAVDALVRDRTDAIYLYTYSEHGWNRLPGKPTTPLRARAIEGNVAKLPIEFTSLAVVEVGEAFDGSRDGAWSQEPYKFSVRALLANAVLMSIMLGFVLLFGTYSITGSMWIAIATAVVGVAAATALITRDVHHKVIATHAPTHPVRVAPREPRVRVGEEMNTGEPEEDEDARARR